MGKFVLPDEDTWVLPKAWRPDTHPRRGGHPAPARVIPPDAAERLRTRLRSDDFSKNMARVSERAVVFDPVLLAKGHRYLRNWRDLDEPGDEADPLGAAVATLFIRRWDGEAMACSVDVWVSRFGVEFAARVVGELSRVLDECSLWSVDPAAVVKTHEDLWRGDDLGSLYVLARKVRSHLAMATDAEYERVCGILGGYRTAAIGRVVTSYLAPTQVAWVDEDCAAIAGWSADEHFSRTKCPSRLTQMLFFAASTVRHLEQLRDLRSDVFGSKEIGTVLDGVGPAAAPILMEPHYSHRLLLNDRGPRSEGRGGPDGIQMLSLIPTDDAFRMLCRATLGAQRLRPGALLKSGVLSRYPVRALRILSELETVEPRYVQVSSYRDPEWINPHEAALYTDLLGTLLLAEPRLLPAVAASLPAAVRARAEEIVASGGAGIGAGWTALLDRHDERRYEKLLDSADDEKRAVAALAAIPTEEAFGHLVDRVQRMYVRPALLVAAKRDPLLALRVLLAKSTAAVGTDAVTTVSELLRNHVLAYPKAVAETLPALDAAARAQVEAIVGATSSAGDTPGAGSAPGDTGPSGVTVPVLAGPPRRSDGKPMRVPELPEWLVVAALPPVTLRDGGQILSQDAVRQLCALLAVSKIADAHPGVAEVRALGEPRSLAALAWTIFEQWQAAQYPAASKLAMVAVALFGDDTTVPALTSLFPAWATGSSLRVRTGMDVLAAIGSDVALTHLHRLSRRARTKGFRQLAEQRLNAVAEARGMQPTQLADRIVPELGLDPDGRMTLDYGPRQFTVGLDEQLQPQVIDQRGKRLARMPRPTAADDEGLATAAYQRFTELKKEAKTVVAERTRALEEAMVVGRRWSGEEFRRLFVRHPLMWQLAHRLLWATFDERGAVAGTFRVAEDRTLADLDDKTFALDAAATVGVAHPWHFAGDRAAWTTVFADNAVIQPFPQLTRELIGLSEAEADAGLESFVGRSVEGRKLFALAAQGWRRCDGAHHSAVLRDWPGDRTVEIEYSPGFHWQDRDAAQKLTGIRVWTTSITPAGSAWSDQPRPADPARFTDLDPIASSEVVRDLRFLVR
ncbi:DUF4132 domain-containing protein [Micromonospora peucetia]|uniref:DUF4132 domain-containing protein n=1 Tax=Micromonospora peucetia TaxID=47871 RepID=UPI00225AB576|nr:DUF4132 domain-containing protein [Micromonospora peucetia]MCX4387991.1 DUF4132 domain-containing protein [Micromonospora peucetia]